MARGGGMQDVELVDVVTSDDAPDHERGGPVSGQPRRRRWWLVPAGAATVVLALLAYQGVTDARERSLLAGLADVPGVLAPIDPDLPVRWELAGPTTEAALYGTVAADATMNIVVDPDGTQRVVAIDLETGAERWSTVVYGPNAGMAAARASGVGTSTGYCLPVGPDGGEPTTLACVVSDGYETYSEDYVQVPATETIVRVLDVRDGDQVAQWPMDDSSVGVSDGRLVLARWSDDDGIDVVVHEPVSGATVWTRHLDAPDAAVSRERPPSIQGVGDVIEISSGSWSSRLDKDGVPLRVQPRTDASTGGRWVVDAPAPDRFVSVSYTMNGTSSTEVFRGDGTVEYSLPGDLVFVSVDDGSLPNLILTLPAPSRSADGGGEEIPLGGLRGSDVASGRTLWTADLSTFGYEALVLLGRVYVLGGDGIEVVDGHSGKLLWTVERPAGVTYENIMTDGRHLFAMRTRGTAQDDMLDAYELTGGAPVWSAPIPSEIEELRTTGRALLGIAYEETPYGSTASRVWRLG